MVLHRCRIITAMWPAHRRSRREEGSATYYIIHAPSMGAAQHWLNGPTLGFTHWASSRGRPQRWRMNGHASSRTVNCERWTQWCGRQVGSPVARLGGDDAEQSEVTVLTAKPRPRRVTTLAAGTESIRLTTVHVQHHAERAADEPSRHKGEITCIEQRGVTKKYRKSHHQRHNVHFQY